MISKKVYVLVGGLNKDYESINVLGVFANMTALSRFKREYMLKCWNEDGREKQPPKTLGKLEMALHPTYWFETKRKVIQW